MIINNPLWPHGKILLKYVGNNLLLDSNIKIDRVTFFNETINNISEDLILKVNLLNDKEILLSLKSLLVYTKKDVWEIQDFSFNKITTIIVDNEYVIVKGNVTFCNEINEANHYLDKYEYDLIFKNTDTLIRKLKEDRIEFIDFRNA